MLSAVIVVALSLAMAGDVSRAEARADEGVIYFLSSDSTGYDNLFAVSPSGGGRRLIDTQMEYGTYLPAASRDGSKIAFGGDDTLRILDVATNVSIAIPGATNEEHTPAWSPDGIRLVVTDIGPEGWTWDLYTMNADGSDKRLVVDSAGTADFADWSPDGTKLAYIKTNGPGDPSQIYVANIDGTGEVVLTSEGANWFPDWSPDGSRIAYSNVGADDEARVYTMNADGSDKQYVVVGDWPSWSPDGKRIAFEARVPGNSDIWVVNVDGSGAQQLTSDPGFEAQPDWAPFVAITNPTTPTPTPMLEPTPLSLEEASSTDEASPTGDATTVPEEGLDEEGGLEITTEAAVATATLLIGLPVLTAFAIRRFTKRGR